MARNRSRQLAREDVDVSSTSIDRGSKEAGKRRYSIQECRVIRGRYRARLRVGNGGRFLVDDPWQVKSDSAPSRQRLRTMHPGANPLVGKVEVLPGVIHLVCLGPAAVLGWSWRPR